RRQPERIVGAAPDTHPHRNEEEDGDGGIARQVIDVPNAAGLAADPRELTVRMVEEIGQDHQQGGDVGPAVGPHRERGRAREANRQPDGGQMIRRDAGAGERRHQGSRQSRIPRTLCARARCQDVVRHHSVRMTAPPADMAAHCTHNRGLVEPDGVARLPSALKPRLIALSFRRVTISTISRRDFLRLSAGTLGALEVVAPPTTQAAEQDRVALVIDPADPEAAAPPVTWAVDQLEAALAQHAVALQRYRAIHEVPAAARCLVVATSGMPVATEALRDARLAPPREAESLALLSASFTGRQGLLACGTDGRGLTYALLELADRIRCGERPEAALTPAAPLIERPHHRVRSIGRLFVSDVQDKPWFHDRAFWPPYLSMLAAQRFNRFQLSLGIGYDSLQGVRDAYLLFAYPFLLSVPGYSVRAVNLADEERERNLEMLQF